MAKSRKLSVPALILVVITAALYWQTTRQGFMVVDDNEYVYENPWVNEGMSWDATRWAFTTYHSANWHPLTWLSHQADWSLYGSFAGGHHLTNLLLHVANTLFLFLLLQSLTGSTWRSWVVAALFGWHPLHVESVAWIAERKDLLSTLCLLGSIWAYCRYAQRGSADNPEAGGEQRKQAAKYGYYALSLVIFAAGIMCKPMIVTLPCLLLLLDYWPLKRIYDLRFAIYDLKGKETANFQPVPLSRAILEKVPFFLLSAGSCLMTLIVQRAGGAIKGTNEESLTLRGLNSLNAYGEYLRQTIWPNPLCIYYPMPHQYPLGGAVVGAVLLCGLTLAAVLCRKRCPWLMMGWLWFVGTLVPVIGLVQVGHQAHADRYTYIPSIGLFIGLVWGVWYWVGQWAYGRKIATGLAAVSLAGCLALTCHQLGYWRDSVTLFTHALAHTESSYFSQNNLGAALSAAGRSKEALAHFREAVRLDPHNPVLYQNVAIELVNEGDLEGATEAFRQALTFLPHNEVLLNNLGGVLAQQGKYQEALEKFREAMRWDPAYPNSYVNAGSAWQALGNASAAVTNYSTALQMVPGSIVALDHLSYLLATCPTDPYHKPDAAIQLAGRAVQITGKQTAGYIETLAIAYAAAGQYSNAVAADENALKIAQQQGAAKEVARLQDELTAYRAGRSPDWNWKQAP